LGALDLEWLLGHEAVAGLPEEARGAVQPTANANQTQSRTAPEEPTIGHDAKAQDSHPHADKGAGQEKEQGGRSAAYAGSAPQMVDPLKPLTGAPLGTPVTLPLGVPLPDLERFWLLSTLAAVGGNRTRCAEHLGIALRTVRNKINEYKGQGYDVLGGRHARDDE
jgi:DNA-binding NtrC family response regulator